MRRVVRGRAARGGGGESVWAWGLRRAAGRRGTWLVGSILGWAGALDG